MQEVKKNLLKLFFVTCSIFCTHWMGANSIVYGQEMNETSEATTETTTNNINEETTVEEISEESQESTVANDETVVQMVDPSLFNSIVPYAQFMNYKYVGDGTLFSTKDVIMEYMPDNNGVFQVAEFTENEAVAFVYQIRPTGLYELACIEDYSVVQDMRYSSLATDGSESFILPTDLKVGTSYQSGYSGEKRRTVTGTAESVSIGSQAYYNVLVIEEEDGQSHKRLYFAENAGIILIEEVLSDGTSNHLMYLDETQGPLQ